MSVLDIPANMLFLAVEWTWNFWYYTQLFWRFHSTTSACVNLLTKNYVTYIDSEAKSKINALFYIDWVDSETVLHMSWIIMNNSSE